MAKGGNKNFFLVENKFHKRTQPAYNVHLASTGELVAKVNQFPGSDSWRFTLVNYPQNHSKMFGTLKAALVGIEKEVL